MIDPNEQPSQESQSTEETSWIELAEEEWGSENVEVFEIT